MALMEKWIGRETETRGGLEETKRVERVIRACKRIIFEQVKYG